MITNSRRWAIFGLATALLLLLAACGGDNKETRGNLPPEPAPATDFQVTIGAFEDGAPVPVRYSCEGENVSPEIAWSGVPVGTNSFAVVMDDPDAPRGVFVHWVLFDLPPDFQGLPENVPSAAQLEDGGIHGRNSAGNTGYTGPCPPPGYAHHYRFTVYALDQMLGLDSSADKQALLDALAGHILAESLHTGTYQR